MKRVKKQKPIAAVKKNKKTLLIKKCRNYGIAKAKAKNNLDAYHLTPNIDHAVYKEKEDCRTGTMKNDLLDPQQHVIFHSESESDDMNLASQKCTSFGALSSGDGDCPKLVAKGMANELHCYPLSIMEDINDFQNNSYRLSDESSSVESDDINEKYLREDASGFDQLHNNVCRMKADVISVKNFVYSRSVPRSPIADEDAVEQMPVEKIDKHSNIQLTSIIKEIVLDKNILPEMRLNNERSTKTKSCRPGSPLCSKFCMAINSNQVLVLLKDPLYIYGTVKVVPLAGTVEIYGFTGMPGNELEIFSPKGCSAVKLVPTTNTETTEAQIDEEFRRLNKYFLLQQIQEIRAHYNVKHDALLLLKRNVNRNRIIKTFTKYMSENVFPNTRTMQMERTLYPIEFQLRCLINSGDCSKPLAVPQQWTQLHLRECSKLMVVGGKSVGKSTLLRYLINRHHRHFAQGVLFIDLDIGQPELFLPQTISCFHLTQPLLGPGCFLNLQPAKAYMIGHTNIMMCAHVYMRAVKRLIEFCRMHPIYSQLPWFVNTMGYNKGFGLELVATVITLLDPTDIIQLQSNRKINNFDIILHPLQLDSVPRTIYANEDFSSCKGKLSYRLLVFDSAIQQLSRFRKEWDMNAKDMRYATLLARLSDALQDSEEWLTDSRMFCAPLNRLKVFSSLNDQCNNERLYKSLEGNVVYLCNLGQCDLEESVECLGIGVVRATDQFDGLIYIVPAMPHDRMCDVNCLAIGELPFPTSMFTNQGDRVTDEGAFVYDSVDVCFTKSVKQIYHRSPEFLNKNI